MTVTTAPLAFDLTLVTTDNGQYYHINNETQSSSGRPVQPRTSVVIDVPKGEYVHGVMIMEASFKTDENFDPIISRPVTDTALTEPGFTYPSWYPNTFWSINSMGDEERLVIIAGQYKSTTEYTGTERVFTSLTVRILTSSEPDVSAPVIHQIDTDRQEGEFAISVDTSDSSLDGVSEVWATFEDKAGHWTSIPLAYDETTGLWQVTITSAVDEFGYFVQAADHAGNVSTSSNKGTYFAPEPKKLYLPVILSNYSP
jgi:hypothetical protein